MYARTGEAISIGDHVPTGFYSLRVDQSLDGRSAHDPKLSDVVYRSCARHVRKNDVFH